MIAAVVFLAAHATVRVTLSPDGAYPYDEETESVTAEARKNVGEGEGFETSAKSKSLTVTGNTGLSWRDGDLCHVDARPTASESVRGTETDDLEVSHPPVLITRLILSKQERDRTNRMQVWRQWGRLYSIRPSAQIHSIHVHPCPEHKPRQLYVSYTTRNRSFRMTCLAVQ